MKGERRGLVGVLYGLCGAGGGQAAGGGGLQLTSASKSRETDVSRCAERREGRNVGYLMVRRFRVAVHPSSFNFPCFRFRVEYGNSNKSKAVRPS